MIPDLQWVRQNFDFFNQKYFQNRLPIPKFSFDCPGDLWGYYDGDAHALFGERISRVFSPGTIGLTTKYSRNEKSVQNTLIHEMIHMYIIVVLRKLPYEEHNSDFHQIAEFINRDGWNISVNNDMCDDDVLNQGEEIQDGNNESEQQQLPNSIICIVRCQTNNGNCVLGMKVYENDVRNSMAIKNSVIGAVSIAFYTIQSPGFANEKSDLSNLYGFTAANEQDLVQKMASYYGENINNFKLSQLQMNESNHNKKLLISEKQEKQLIKILKEEKKKRSIDPQKVLLLKKKLDEKFIPLDYEIMKGGDVECIKIAGRLTPKTKQVIEKLYEEDLADWAADVCKNMFLDEKDCEDFAKLVVNRWLNNKISVHGMLDVNSF